MKVPPEGNLQSAKFVIIGEAPSFMEIKFGRPFVGPIGELLDASLRDAGISRRDCYLTNVFPSELYKPKQGAVWLSQDKPVWHVLKKTFTEDGNIHLFRLRAELEGIQNKILIPLGGIALHAVTGMSSIASWRGSFMQSNISGFSNFCVPSLHPSAMQYGNTINRWYLTNDLKRAKRQSQSATLIKPRYDIHYRPTFAECLSLLKEISQAKECAMDIEVMMGAQVSMISYSWHDKESVSIPYGKGGWSLEEEAMLWQHTAMLMASPTLVKIFHNGIFDTQFLLQNHAIHVAPPVDDTMVQYAVMYPEFRKGLAVLSSLYTDQPFWKHLVKHGEIAKEDG